MYGEVNSVPNSGGSGGSDGVGMAPPPPPLPFPPNSSSFSFGIMQQMMPAAQIHPGVVGDFNHNNASNIPVSVPVPSVMASSLLNRRSNSLPNCSDNLGLDLGHGSVGGGGNGDNGYLDYDYDYDLDRQIGADMGKARPRVSSVSSVSSSSYAVYPLGVDLNNAELTHESLNRSKPKSNLAYSSKKIGLSLIL